MGPDTYHLWKMPLATDSLAFFDASRTPPSYLTTCSEREGPFSVEGRGKRNMPMGKQRLVKSQVHVGQRFRCLGGVSVCLCFHDIDNIRCFWTPHMLFWINKILSSLQASCSKRQFGWWIQAFEHIGTSAEQRSPGPTYLGSKGKVNANHSWMVFFPCFFHVWVLVDGKTWQMWSATLMGVECLTA